MGEIAEERLGQQQIGRPANRRGAEVVRAFGAMQAQDYRNALWAVGLRTVGATEKTIEEEIAAGEIVRTWPMRGTIHLVAAADVHWMLALLTPRVLAAARKRVSQLGLNEETFARCEEVCRDALSGGQKLTREALLARFAASGIQIDGQRGYHIIWRLAQQRLICFGPREAKSPTFVLLDDWIPEPRRSTPADPLGELARRYFASHGPATLADFVWWSGLRVSDARSGIRNAELAEKVIDGVTYLSSATTGPSADHGPRAHLLPAFDEYLLAYRDRSAVLEPKEAHEIVPGNNGIFLPFVVIDGRVSGTWKRTFKADVVEIAASMFTLPTRAMRREITVAAEAYSRFVGLPAKLRYEAPSSR